MPTATRKIRVPCNRGYTRAEEQIGKVGAVNKLAAILVHELNNPAATAKSAALAERRAGQPARASGISHF
jgi:nitrogen-specific signal transduction histidine kinase